MTRAATKDEIELLEKLAGLADPLTETRFAEDAPRCVTDDNLHILSEIACGEIDVPAPEAALRFRAYYAHAMGLRFRSKYEDYRTFVGGDLDRFVSGGPAYRYYQAYLKAMGELDRAVTPEEMELAVDRAKVARADAEGCDPALAGALNVVAEGVAQLGEVARERVSGDLLDEAVGDIERALRIRDYPKYHATKARLLALRGDYNDARKSIAHAMEREWSASHSLAPIADYRDIRARINAAEQFAGMRTQAEHDVEAIKDRLTTEVNGLQQRLENSEFRIIEVVGLIAAVLALIITNADIASNAKTVGDGARLMTMGSGAVVLVFAVLGYLFGRTDSAERNYKAGAIGVALLLIGLWA